MTTVTKWLTAVVLSAAAVLVPFSTAGGGTKLAPTHYLRGHAKSCRVGYRGKTERGTHIVEVRKDGKLVRERVAYRYVECFLANAVKAGDPPTVTTVTSSDNPATVGDSVTYTVTVSHVLSSTTGTIQVWDGATQLTDCDVPTTPTSPNANGEISGTCAERVNSAGSLDIVGVFTGDSVYAQSAGGLTETVNAPQSTTTTTAATSTSTASFGGGGGGNEGAPAPTTTLAPAFDVTSLTISDDLRVTLSGSFTNLSDLTVTDASRDTCDALSGDECTLHLSGGLQPRPDSFTSVTVSSPGFSDQSFTWPAALTATAATDGGSGTDFTLTGPFSGGTVTLYDVVGGAIQTSTPLCTVSTTPGQATAVCDAGESMASAESSGIGITADLSLSANGTPVDWDVSSAILLTYSGGVWS